MPGRCSRRHLRRQHVLRADLAAVFQLLRSPRPSARPSAWSPTRRFVNSAPRRRSPRTACLARGQFAAPPRTRREGLDGADDDLLARLRAPPPAVALLLPPSPLIVATTPMVRSKPQIASCNCWSITLRSETTRRCRTASSSFASCRSARKCAVQAMEFVLPEPAECWIRYLPPAPSSRPRPQLPRRVQLVVAREDHLASFASSCPSRRPGSGLGFPASYRAAHTSSHR